MFIYSNAQRAGVIIRMTLDELKSPIERDDTAMYRVCNHKTGTKGPARIVVSKEYLPLVQAYIDEVRPKIYVENDKLRERAFLTWSGKEYDRQGQSIARLARQLKCRVSNPTLFRKAMGTQGARVLDDVELRRLNTHMNHDPYTARLYYQFGIDDNESFDVQKQMMDEVWPSYLESRESTD